MSGPVEYDPDEIDRAANGLARASEQVKQSGRQVRSVVQGMNRFRGGEAEKAKQRADQYARALEAMANDIDAEAKALRRLAQAVRALPKR